jgi:hypothetical protein
VLLGRWNWWPSKLSRRDAVVSEVPEAPGDDAEPASVPAHD